jgi:hypothetical protein
MALIENGHALAVIPTEQEAALTYKLSTNAATLCGEIVKATATKIQGKKYVQVEGWLALAAAHGCLVSIRDVKAVDGGIQAIAELRRMSDQSLLATAEGFVGDDEPMWAKRPMYARRAMAQTRASSRVCRTVFAFAVVLIDKDLGTTPAEEMAGVAEPIHVIGNGDTLAQAAREITEMTGNTESQYKLDAAKKAKQDADSFISTIKLSGQTVESLNAWWKANSRRLKGMSDNHPEEFDRVEKVFVDARDAAQDRAA